MPQRRGNGRVGGVVVRSDVGVLPEGIELDQLRRFRGDGRPLHLHGSQPVAVQRRISRDDDLPVDHHRELLQRISDGSEPHGQDGRPLRGRGLRRRSKPVRRFRGGRGAGARRPNRDRDRGADGHPDRDEGEGPPLGVVVVVVVVVVVGGTVVVVLRRRRRQAVDRARIAVPAGGDLPAPRGLRPPVRDGGRSFRPRRRRLRGGRQGDPRRSGGDRRQRDLRTGDRDERPARGAGPGADQDHPSEERAPEHGRAGPPVLGNGDRHRGFRSEDDLGERGLRGPCAAAATETRKPRRRRP
mmetsp:Transcript_19440/g.45252  ORF Transcript_19440/g.45252 Transcript_19440/m.45252 type:complete len:298 (+) Transcript_19440:116-1009(+)